MAEDVERPVVSPWVWVLVGVLLVVGAMSIVSWIVSAVWGLVKLAVLVVVVLAAVALLRSAFRRD